MPQSILLVDDDAHIRQLLSFALSKAGFIIHEAGDGEAALEQIAISQPDLVVLDINLPRLNGLEVCRRIRARSDLPIVFLSSREDEIDRVLGIELGADDYVVKPFSPREVVARVAAILRRTGVRTAPGPETPWVSIGRLRLDLDGWSAFFDDQDAPLTATEFSLLKTLASASTRVFSRDELIDRVRGPGFAVTDRTIDSHVRNIRAKFLRVGGVDIIETRAGIGYRLGACRGETP